MNEAIERVVISKDWITIMLLISVTLLILNRLKSSDRYYKLKNLLVNNTYINSYSKANPLLFNSFNIIFLSVYIIVISFLLFIAIHLFEPKVASFDFLFYLKIILVVCFFIGLRVVAGVLLGVLFEKERVQKYFTFLKTTYLSNYSLIMLPLIAVHFYFESDIYTYFLLIVAVLLFLYYYILLIKNNQSLVFGKSFYFILYLCTLEIAPFIIMTKILII
ncbi:DUF4271 domain-containing protein [Aureibaculum sp. 2210JD6-5]|uniref:DUF4271 domain-containing protein n=1 Tax=Aureibaculum sp. 2210JD6-5 TaxID=3103957 RepID=UPI002AAD3D0D|nr:DUF4271 domain-containing protein [Aureibaculum sp. 2210JD6-5]MDY7394664.1 DUF4271 domain-containing protein [Aureibaculum sp. 2210JD6-5]